MTMSASFLAVCGYNLALYVVVRKEWLFRGDPVRHRLEFQVSALLGEMYLDQHLIRATFHDAAGYDIFFRLPVVLVAGATFWPFVFFVLGDTYDRLHRELSDANRMTVEPTFHQVEAAMKRRDYVKAETMLREAIEEDPRCPEARLRLVDVLRARGEVALCAGEMRALLPLLPTEEQRAAALFRLFDLLVDHDPKGAEEAMRRMQADFSAPYVSMASARLRRLRAASETRAETQVR